MNSDIRKANLPLADELHICKIANMPLNINNNKLSKKPPQVGRLRPAGG